MNNLWTELSISSLRFRIKIGKLMKIISKKKIFDASQLNEIFFDCSADSRTSLAWFHGTSLLAANSIKAASRGEYPTQFQPPNRSTMRARVSRLSSRSFARRTILLVQLYSSILFPERNPSPRSPSHGISIQIECKYPRERGLKVFPREMQTGIVRIVQSI